MKKVIKKIITMKLSFAARILLWRKKPEVIAITGSAGKTTTKEVIKHLLSTDFDVLAGEEGYNTEIGAPLMLLDIKAPTSTFSAIAWLRIILKAYKRALFTSDFPEKVVVEMGADAPGDIDHLVRLFKPEKAIILAVLPVHTENFVDIEGVAKEKGRLALGVKKGGTVFLNIDNEHVRKMEVVKGVRKVYFGKREEADYRVTDIKSDLSGISFTLTEGDENTKLSARLYGNHLIYPLVSAIALARSEHISYKKIKESLKTLKPFKGRMNILEGKNGSIIIDDTYNANPASVIEALDFLSVQKGRKIAVLGTMGELGDYEKKGHAEVGEKAAKTADLLVTVGEIANKYIPEAAQNAGMPEGKISSFNNSDEAGEHLKKIIRGGDIILAKGSQNAARMEKAVAKLLKDPSKAEKLLVRQSDFWKTR